MYTQTQIDASNFAGSVNFTFMFIIGIALVFLIGLTVLMIYFIYKYNREKNPKPTQIKGSVKLELIWTIIPTILALLMFYFGWVGWKPMKNPPDDARTVRAIARMWNFQFIYENGKRSDTLILPVNEPVRLELVSLDVIHSLYIPAFRVKEDMIPGKEKEMWFIPKKEGEFDLFCTEYCGLQHSYMYTGVNIISDSAFNAWYADTTASLPSVAEGARPGAAGLQILQSNGCNACHSTDGTRLVGPSYLGLYGSERTVTTDGETRTVIADDDYIKRAIYEPDADIVEGYNKGLMLSYKDMISEKENELIIEYLKTVSEE